MPVYFIQAPDSGLIKIGRVRRPENVEKRIRALQLGSPTPLIVLGIITDCNPRYEIKLHRQFEHLRRHGEWFEPAPDLLDFISRRDTPIEEVERAVTSGLAGWLRQELQIRQLRPVELARKTGLHASTISRILSGQVEPSDKAHSMIAKALQVPPEKVFALAGILPTSLDKSDILKELTEVVNQLPENEQREVLKYARYRLINI